MRNIKKFLTEYKYIILIIIVGIFGLLFSIINSRTTIQLKEEDNVSLEQIDVIPEKTDSPIIKIEIKGSVVNPGVYQINEDTRVIDAINLAGGLKKDADTNYINLSKKLKDEMVIKIYSKEEIKNINKIEIETIVEYIEKDCICEDKTNDVCVDKVNDGLIVDDSDLFIEKEEKISINKSNADLLSTLPGIGISKANDIINYRNQNGMFQSIDDIKNVSGIGEKMFEKIKNLITI